MYEILVVLDIVTATALIGMILLQQSKGADAGMSMSGSSGNMFGPKSSANILSKITAVLATLFFIFSLFIGRLSTNVVSEQEKIDIMVEQVESSAKETQDSIPD
ncbi:MAG: preprotein translocase subunit SecG [Shewanellaceae bacterium]|nr:preprotein translocase subunit SecG [Shewanellaceae bacterium]